MEIVLCDILGCWSVPLTVESVAVEKTVVMRRMHVVLRVAAGSLLVWAWLVSAAALALTATDYASALDKSILFFDVQRSGKLPSWQRVTWRANSALTDGKTSNVCADYFIQFNELINDCVILVFSIRFPNGWHLTWAQFAQPEVATPE